MLIEIIRELTRTKEKKDVMSEQVPTWEKRVGAQKAQSAVRDSKNEDFDKIRTVSRDRVKLKEKCKQMLKTHKEELQ